MNKNEFIEGLEIMDGNDWEFNNKIKRDLYNSFNHLDIEKWIILCNYIYESCRMKPVFAVFYQEALAMNYILIPKTQGEIEIEERYKNGKPKVSSLLIQKLKEKAGLVVKKMPGTPDVIEEG